MYLAYKVGFIWMKVKCRANLDFPTLLSPIMRIFKVVKTSLFKSPIVAEVDES